MSTNTAQQIGLELSREQINDHLKKSLADLVTLSDSCEQVLQNMEQIIKSIRNEQQRIIALIRQEVTLAFDR
jgi:methanogenic corrinoid protein MtbC1